MKPLILMNGKTLLAHAVDHALDAWEAAEIIIVGAPENVSLMRDVMQPYCEQYHWVIQPRPTGVVNAIARGLRLARHQAILILCADNTFQYRGPISFQKYVREIQPLFGVRDDISLEAGRRFTRYRTRRLDVSTHNAAAHIDAGVELIGAGEPGPGDGCWIGPLLLGHGALDAAVTGRPDAPIVEIIKLATADGQQLMPLQMQCEDFGILEMHGG